MTRFVRNHARLSCTSDVNTLKQPQEHFVPAQAGPQLAAVEGAAKGSRRRRTVYNLCENAIGGPKVNSVDAGDSEHSSLSAAASALRHARGAAQRCAAPRKQVNGAGRRGAARCAAPPACC